MDYQCVIVCTIVVINLIGLKCIVWDTSQDILPEGTLKQFRRLLRRARNVVVFTGAGISTDSGIMTYRGSWGYWRKWNCRELDVSQRFRSLSLVGIAWEFNNFRRDYILCKNPNNAHYAIVELEKNLEKEGKNFTLITLNTDGLHSRAGSQNIIELFGTMWKTECTACGNVENNTDNPICPALKHCAKERSDKPYFVWAYNQRIRKMIRKEYPRIIRRSATINNEDLEPPVNPIDLPHCKLCKRMLRTYMTLQDEQAKFQEFIDSTEILMGADLAIMIGISFTNVTLSPLAYSLVVKGIPIAEFNTQKTSITSRTQFHFRGLAVETIPPALNLSDTWDLH